MWTRIILDSCHAWASTGIAHAGCQRTLLVLHFATLNEAVGQGALCVKRLVLARLTLRMVAVVRMFFLVLATDLLGLAAILGLLLVRQTAPHVAKDLAHFGVRHAG